MSDAKEIKDSMRFTIQDICDNIGPRSPCSKEEAECAVYIQNFFKKYSNITEIEKFNCHPGSYRAAFRIPTINLILTTISYWIYYFYPNIISISISIILILFSIIVIETNVIRNIELIDPLFKKKDSTNVFAKIKPTEKAERLILIGGHHDSHWEFPILKKWPKLYIKLMAIPIIFSFFMLAIYLLKLILYFISIPYLFVPLIDLILLIVLSVLIPIMVYTAINCVSKNPVMGADDNLTSIAIIFEIIKYLNRSIGLKNTEIWLVSHGCEEIGDRGSKRFSQKHFDELKDAFVINIDMVGGKGSELKILINEVRSVVKHTKELCEELSKIANELNITHTIGATMAFTDSMAYSRRNIKACSILGTPKKGFATHYHTLNDTIDKLNFDNLLNCYSILIEFINRVENKSFQMKS